MPPDLSARAGLGSTSTSDGLRAAHAALLRQPVLALETDPQGYTLARRHLGALRAWHQRRTGWLILARGHTLRLVRSPSVLPMGALQPELASPRDVACLAWALAFAHHPQVAGRGIGRQFLLTELATAITDASRAAAPAPDAAHSPDAPPADGGAPDGARARDAARGAAVGVPHAALAARSRSASRDARAPEAARADIRASDAARTDVRAPDAACADAGDSGATRAARSLAAAYDAGAPNASRDADAPTAALDAQAPDAPRPDAGAPSAARAARSLAAAGDARAADVARPAAAPFDFARRADAHSLRRALRALAELGLLRAVDGSEDAWLDGEGPADALYEFTDAATTFLAGLDRAALEAVRQPAPEPAPTAPSQQPAPWSPTLGHLPAPTTHGYLPDPAPTALNHVSDPAPRTPSHLLEPLPTAPSRMPNPSPPARGHLPGSASTPPGHVVSPAAITPGNLTEPPRTTPGYLAEPSSPALEHLPELAPTTLGHLLEPAPTVPGQLAAVAELAPLQRAWRALLGGPVFVRYDDPAAFAALWEARRQVAADLEQMGDELLDITPFYARLVRPAGTTDPGDARLSLRRALDHAVLCFCSHLRAAVSRGDLGPPDPDSDCVVTTRPALARVFEQTVADDARHWGRQLQARAGRPELFDDVCAAMRRLGLLRGPDRRGTAILLPTAAAYTVSYASDPPPAATNA